MLMIRLENFGKQASTISNPAIAQAITRLVAPVVFSMPTKLGLALIPGAPKATPTAHPIPSAVTPTSMFFMSGRRQAASFICWQVVRTPTTRKPEARPAIAKGMMREGSKPKDRKRGSGNAKTGRSLIERVDKILGTLSHAKNLQIGQENPRKKYPISADQRTGYLVRSQCANQAW